MINSRSKAIKLANESKTNVVGMCQAWTRSMYNAPSVGDVDSDGDSDAVDGWRSEPRDMRFPGDRKVPIGYPVAWYGGSKGHGHLNPRGGR